MADSTDGVEDGSDPSSQPLIASLTAAVAANPGDVPLRLHLADMLNRTGRRSDAVRHAALVLAEDPDHPQALALISGSAVASIAASDSTVPADAADSFDATLAALDAELDAVAPLRFTDSDPVTEANPGLFEADAVGVRLADVGGMDAVKARLEATFLAPLRNPELGKLYRTSLAGGLLLYGPPGCGKTFLARALAGEMGAKFISVGLADVLDMWIGQSERNIKELFATARRAAPCVLFLDEVDALGGKRTNLHSAARGTVNQLLTEMDGIGNADDDGVFVLGATNHPWDVDVALRRPGRFDRLLFVTPPDAFAREAILRLHLRDRPIAGIDTKKIAAATDGFSGADLAYLCQVAAESALLDAARSGTTRMIEMRDMTSALSGLRPSMGPWLEVARNVAQFANQSGSYDELLAYLRSRKLA